MDDMGWKIEGCKNINDNSQTHKQSCIKYDFFLKEEITQRIIWILSSSNYRIFINAFLIINLLKSECMFSYSVLTGISF